MFARLEYRKKIYSHNVLFKVTSIISKGVFWEDTMMF